MSEAWLQIYQRVATDAANERAADNLLRAPKYREPASWMDAMRGAWSGETWMGRLTSEDLFGNALYRGQVRAMHPDIDEDDSWTPEQGDYRGVEQFAHELSGVTSRHQFEVKKLNLMDRQRRIEEAASRNGVMHHIVAHMLDPTIVVGYGVGRAALGLPARVVGARVAAVEASLVGSQQAMMAARYEDRTAGDAVRAGAYAAAFGFVLGAGISKALYGTKGKGWATGSLDFGTRQRAAAARQTTMNIVDETVPLTPERAERVAAAYRPATDKLDTAITKADTQVGRLGASLGIKAGNETDEVLAKLYEAGDKATRQRVTRLRNARERAGELHRERSLLEMERKAAEFAKDSDTWKSNTLAAVMSGRKGIVASMLPRTRVTADSVFERGIPGLNENLNNTLTSAFEGLRDGARLLTRSHGMDPGPGKMAGANVEDIHMREITQRMRTDEQLRTAAIHSIRNTNYPHALYTPTVRSVTGVFKWSANKAMELPHVLSGGKRFKPKVLGSAEDDLELWLQKIADEVKVEGSVRKLEHIDAPAEVKALYEFRQNQYQEIGKALRDHNLMYIQRSLDEEFARMDAQLDAARRAMDEAPTGSREWDRAFDEWDRANRRMGEIEFQAEAYKMADDPTYTPVSLMAHKVAADKEGFIKAAVAHFWANPTTRTRQSRFKEGATKPLPLTMTPRMVEGRALALWHATVHRADYAGRPVGRAEFVRKLDEVIEEIGPGRREAWAKYNDYMADSKAPVAERPVASTVEEAAADSLILRVDGIKRAESLSRGDAGGRYLQSEMFETGRLDPKLFRNFIEDRPTLQYRAYLERELRRVIAAEKLGDPDGMNPLAAADLRMRELRKALGEEPDAVDKLKQELASLKNEQDNFLLGRLREREIYRTPERSSEYDWKTQDIADLLRQMPSGGPKGVRGPVAQALEDLVKGGRTGETIKDLRVEAARLDAMENVRVNGKEANETLSKGIREIVERRKLIVDETMPGEGKMRVRRDYDDLPTPWQRAAASKEWKAELPADEIKRLNAADEKAVSDAIKEIEELLGSVKVKTSLQALVDHEINNVTHQGSGVRVALRTLYNASTWDVKVWNQFDAQMLAKGPGESFMSTAANLRLADGKIDVNVLARINKLLTDTGTDKALSRDALAQAIDDIDQLLAMRGGKTIDDIMGMDATELFGAKGIDLAPDVRKALEEALEELTERANSYDLLRRQMMGEVLFENSNAFIDKMNTAAGLAANISTAADLGMAGYSVTIDLGQAMAYYGMNPVRLGRLLMAVRNDPIMRKALQDPALRHQFGVSGEVVRGARLRAIQGADSTFGNQGGFLSTGNYFGDLARWTGNMYAEAASNVMNASLLNPVTDLTQALAAPLATTRIMQAIGRVASGTGEKIDANILRRIGMEPDMAARVWAQYQDGQKGVYLYAKGTNELSDKGAIILPEFSSWRDQALAHEVLAMIGGDIRVATLHPGIASNRVWQGMGGALQAVGRLYYMFTRWAMVSSANIYGKNIEDGTYQNTATALMYSTMIQALVNMAKEPDFVTMGIEERLKNAMVMSGGFGYLGIMNERLERLSGHQLGLRPLMGIDTFAHDPDSLRFRAQGLGPPAGKAAAAVDSIAEQRYGSLGRLLMPYQNWWLWAGAVRIGTGRIDELTEE